MTDIVIETLTPDEKLVLLKDLEEAYYSGTTRVRFRDRDVSYRSLAEMKQIMLDLKGNIAPRQKRNVVLTTFSRGY